MPKSTVKQNFEANSDMFCKILPTISPTIDMSTVNNETIRQTDAEQKKIPIGVWAATLINHKLGQVVMRRHNLFFNLI